MIHCLKNFFDCVRTLFAYLPIIWSDRDWDSFYLTELIVFKLKRMEKYFNEANIIEDSKKIADSIKKAHELLEKSQDEDNYCKEELKEFEKKYGERIYRKEKDDGGIKCISTYSKIKETNKKKKKMADEEFFKIMKKKRDLALFDRDQAFSMISLKLDLWWD